MDWAHVYGPVESRRFGRSLGVSVVPGKTCNCDCVFCGLGHTAHRPRHRQGFFAPDEILAEIRAALALHGSAVDYLTFCGEGEPTLCQSLGYLIVQTKQLTPVPVAVLTNGTLLHRDDVQRSLQLADVVVMALCAADHETFSRLHRPGPNVKVDRVLDGILAFRQAHAGQVWVEVMLVAGANDGEVELRRLRQALDQIRPDRVFLAVPCDPPTESWVKAPDAEALARARRILPQATVLEGAAGGAHRPAVHHIAPAQSGRPD
ncbi:MAG: radical SAM protein [Gemmatimonadota bacterium]